MGVSKARSISIKKFLGEDLKGSIEIKSGFLTIAVRGYLKCINFNVFLVGKYNIILGIL